MDHIPETAIVIGRSTKLAVLNPPDKIALPPVSIILIIILPESNNPLKNPTKFLRLLL